MGDGGGVRSLQRAFELLELLADADGEASLSELAERSGLPAPTIYRLVRTLVNAGYLRQQPSRRYALGPRLIRLGETSARRLGTWARPALTRLVEEVEETVNMALLDGDEVVYVAQVPSKHSMRMFTEPGRRAGAHCTGVGKALLAQLPDERVAQILARTGMPAHTPRTITDPAAMMAELARVRAAGHALDDEEQELGVRCVAVPLLGAPTLAAISTSGPAGRLSYEAIGRLIPYMRDTATVLVSELTATPRTGH